MSRTRSSTAVNRQLNATLSWHIARSERVPDAATLERQMYAALGQHAAARATAEIIGSEPVRDAASDLAEAMAKGMDAAADGCLSGACPPSRRC